MAYCDQKAWKVQLKEMEQSDIETFVPEHGAAGDKSGHCFAEAIHNCFRGVGFSDSLRRRDGRRGAATVFT